MRWLCPEVMHGKLGGKDQWCWKASALCIGVVAGGGMNASLVQCCGGMVDRTLSCGWYEVWSCVKVGAGPSYPYGSGSGGGSVQAYANYEFRVVASVVVGV